MLFNKGVGGRMQEVMMQLKIIVGAAFSGIAYLLGGFDSLIQTLAIFVIMDYVLGVIAAGKKEELNTQKGLWGIIKKFALFCLVAVAVQLDTLNGLTDIPVIRTAVIIPLIGNEGLSILKNLDVIGIWIPENIKKALEAAENISEGNGEKWRIKQ